MGTVPAGVQRHAAPRRSMRPIVVTLAVLAVLAPLVVTAVRQFGGPGGTTISVFWWGGQARADLTHQALELYRSRHPQVRFAEQWQGNSGYFDKLATLAAGGSTPDLFQIDDNWLSDYVSRGVTLDLKPFLGATIDTSGFSKGLSSSGTIAGKVGGIAAAENTPAMIYDKTAVEQYGISTPHAGMSWEALIAWGVALKSASGGKVAGTMDPSADYKALQIWLRQQSLDLYDGGKLGFGAGDLTRWLQLWADARSAGATPPADVIHSANAGDITKQLVATQQAGTSFVWSNQLEELSKHTDHELGIAPYPGDPAGQWARASMYWSAAATTEHAAIVADVINFMVNDPDAGKILGAERGLAPNVQVRARITGTLSPAMRTSMTFETGLADKFGPTPPPPPAGHGQLKTQLTQAAESVQFARATPQAAASAFFQQLSALVKG